MIDKLGKNVYIFMQLFFRKEKCTRLACASASINVGQGPPIVPILSQ